MNQVLNLIAWLVSAVYAVSFSYYLANFRYKHQRYQKLIDRWMLAAVVLHTVYLLLLGFHVRHIPVGDVYQVLTTMSWLAILVYLFLKIRLQERTMGVFFVPVVFLLHAISSVLIDYDKPLADVLTDIVFEVHVVTLIGAYVAFAFSFIASIMYILLSREIHSKELGIFFERLPSLEFFDKLSNHAVNIGLILVSLGIGLGIYLGLSIWEGLWYLDPKLMAVVISWGIYLLHFIARKAIGWQGRRAALVSVVGFNWLLFSFLIVNAFFSKVHNFQ